MAQKTLQEQFEPLIAGRYTGSPAILWRQLYLTWSEDAVLDVTEDAKIVEGPNGLLVWTDSLQEAIARTIESRDYVRLLILADLAEENGVSAEVCNLTRTAVRVQYSEVK